MSRKIGFSDIGGGATPRPGISPGGGAGITGAAEPESLGPGDVIRKADAFFGDVKSLIRSIDEVVGFFLSLKGQKQTIEGQTMEGTPELQAASNPSPAPPQQDSTAIMALLDRILKGEGDIPLSKFVEGIKNQEQWLIKYATEGPGEAQNSP